MGFCTVCGSAVESGARFCTVCGTQTSIARSNGSAAAAQPALYTSAPDPTPAPDPNSQSSERPAPELFAYESRTSGDSGFRAVLFIIAVAIVLGGLTAYFFLRTEKPRGPAPIIDGRAAAAVQPSQTYGLENYPGARPIAAYGAPGENVIAAFETTDTPPQVMGYYRVRFPVSQITGDSTTATLSADMNGRRVLVVADALIHGSRVRILFDSN